MAKRRAGSNPFLASRRASDGPRPNPFMGGGKAGPSPKQARAQAVEQAKRKLGGGGGIGGLIGETVGIVRSAPSGVAHMGKDLAVELGHRFRDTGRDIGMAGGGLLRGDFGDVGEGVVRSFVDTPINPAKTIYGVGKGIAEGGDQPDSDQPLSSSFGQSFRRTGERVGETAARTSAAAAELSTGHPGRAKAELGKVPYIEAYKQGHLVGSVVEDVGNVAVVAGAAAKGLSAASGGALEEASAARATAKTLTEKVIPTLEKQVAEADAAVAASQEQALSAVAARGPAAAPTAYTQITDQTARQSVLHAQLEGAKAQAVEATQRAESLLAGRSRAMVQAHRMASVVERMGNRGANVPIAPFEVAGKGLGKLAREVVTRIPGLSERLAPYAELNAVRRLSSLQRKSLSSLIEGQTAELEQLIHRMNAELERSNRVFGGDADLWHASLVDQTGANQLLLDGVKAIEAGSPGARADAITQLAEMPSFDGSPRALELSLDMAEWRRLKERQAAGEDVGARLNALAERGVDDALMAKVAQVQDGLRENVLSVLQGRYLAGKGTSVALSDEALAQRAERATSDQPNPVELERLRLQHDDQMRAAVERRDEAAKQVNEAQARIRVAPENVADLAAAQARDAELAGGRAGELVQQAATDPRMLEELVASVGLDPGTLVLDDLIPAHTLPDGTTVPAEGRTIAGEAVEVTADTPYVMADDLTERLSGRVLEAGGRVSLQRRHPVLGRAVRDLPVSGLRWHPNQKPAVVSRWERQMEYRGRAAEARATADRLAAKAERLRQQNPSVVQRVVRAVDKVMRARSRAGEATAKAAQVRENMLREAGVTNPADLPDWMLTREQYGDRARAAAPEGALDVGAAGDWTHAEAVADAMEQGQPVPPWVVADYKKVVEPRRPENRAGATHWDPFTGAPKTQDARNYLERKRAADAENAARASNPHVQRILANQTKATKAWNASGAGREYRALVEQTANARKAVVAQARAELVADAAFAELPDSVPFVPGRMSEYYDAVQQGLGAPDWSIAEEMTRLRERSKRWENASDEDVFAAAYGGAYDRLPKVAKENLTKLSPQEVHALYLQWRAGRISPDLLGLDGIVDTWATSMGRDLSAGHREATYRAFTDAIERRARLRRIETSRASGGFLPGDLTEFFRTTLDDEMRGLADDPVMQTMLGRGSKETAARALFEGRLETAAARLDAMIPRADELARRLEREPFPYEPDQVHRVIADLQGVEAADDFMGAWMAAGEPPLGDALTMLEQGETPAWLLPAAREAEQAVARAGRRAAASLRLDDANVAFHNDPEALVGEAHLTPEERALRGEMVAQRRVRAPEIDLERAVAKGGAQTVADIAEAQDARAVSAEARAAGEDPGVLRQQASARLAQPLAGQIQRHGAEVNEYLRSVRDLRTAQKRIDKWLPDRFEREIAAAEADLRNAPVRYRRALHVANGAREVYGKWIADLEKMAEDGAQIDEATLNALRQAEMETVKTLRDVTHPGFTIGPDGAMVERPPLIDPEYVPGGRVHTGASKGGGEPRVGKSASERQSRAGVLPNTPEEMRQVLNQRVRVEIRNQTARAIEAQFGLRPGQVLGQERMQQLGDEYQKNRRRANTAMLEEMGAEGYVPWNPRKLQPSSPHIKGFGTFVVDDVDALTTETLWIPKGIADGFERHFKAPGTWEMRARKYYDKPTNVWKAGVLAFSPRWHVNNVVGNFIMATAGAGVSPGAWMSGMRDAYAVLRHDDLRFRAEHDLAAETRLGRAVDRVRGGAEKRLARADRRIARLPGDTREAVLGPEGIHLDPRVPQRGAGSAAIDPVADLDRGIGSKNRLQRAAQRSYEFNGFMDDLNRVAVFLEKHRSMSDQELAAFAAKHPGLAGIGTDKAAMRKEAAVRMSLDALGNFRKMSPFERQVVRRVIPFYAWLRHITTLAVRLPITNPVRVAWMLHLADLYGEPPEFDVLANTIPLGGDSYLRLPRANPFEDVIVAPSSGNLGQVVQSGLSSVGPIPRLAFAAAGLDTRTGLQSIERAPGTGNVDGYGRDSITPLITRPQEMLNFAARTVPLGQLAIDTADALKYGDGSIPRRLWSGQSVLRYPTGQPYKTGAGTTIPTGRPLRSSVEGLLGVPAEVSFDLPRMRQAQAERRKTRARAKARYQREPASSGAGGGSNPFMR